MKVKLNEYNSEAFAMTMADIVDFNESDTPDDVRQAIAMAQGIGCRHLAVKVPTSWKVLTNTFLSQGFLLVDAQLDHQLAPLVPQEVTTQDGYTVRYFEESDLRAVASIAESSFTTDRWHSDPSLQNDLCDRYYAQWVESCAAGYAQAIFVAEAEGRIAGFLTLRVQGPHSRIDLTAVDISHRGKGIYRTLVKESINWAYANSIFSMKANTQINNYGSRVTWTRLGFIPTSSCYVLHLPMSQ